MELSAILQHDLQSRQFYRSTLNKLGVTPFQETAVGQSFVGDIVDYMKPLKNDPVDKAISALRQNIGFPQAPQLGLAAGNQNFRSGQGFQPHAQSFNFQCRG